MPETTQAVQSQPTTPPPKISSILKRRSARVLDHDPIVAPGFGTRKDLAKLAKELSSGTSVLPVEAVEAMMRSRGRGIGKTEEKAAAAPVSSAWADFMAEEGVGSTTTAATSSSDTPSKKRKDAPAASVPGGKRVYELPIAAAGATTGSKKAKTSKEKGGVLLQTGTLDSTVVGRSKVKLTEPYHLTEPTRILPNVAITNVFTSCNAVHSVAVDTNGTAYGWGRNESAQLGGSFPDNVVMPTQLELPGKLVSAALGKSHTLFLLEDGSVWSVGNNKAGQCGVKAGTELVPNYRKCVFADPDVTVVQISCGEDFSAALTSDGYVYTAGSSEFGQLGNGETGEYIVSAGRMGFANCNVFTCQATFCHAPSEKVHGSGDSVKVIPLPEDVRIQQIACGKHHTIALEAVSDQPARVFSFGCGDYGCLGHGIQADEYFPRCIGSLQNIILGQGNVGLAAGAHCSLVQTGNGHLYYWGKHRSVGEAKMRPALVDALANNQHVVSFCAAGGQTVVCSTANAVTVAWGQDPHGALGLGEPKSSAKPTFVPALDGCRISSLACGYGHTLFVVRNEDKEDITAVKKLAELDPDAVEGLVEAAESKESKRS